VKFTMRPNRWAFRAGTNARQTRNAVVRLVARMRVQSTSSISSMGNARPGSLGSGFSWLGGDRPAGEVDEEAHVTDLAEHALGDVRDLEGVGQVRHERLGRRRLAQLPAEAVQAGLVDVDHRKANALRRQTPEDGLPDAARGPRHDGHAPREPGQLHA
jgi:hypothetical protein